MKLNRFHFDLEIHFGPRPDFFAGSHPFIILIIINIKNLKFNLVQEWEFIHRICRPFSPPNGSLLLVLLTIPQLQGENEIVLDFKDTTGNVSYVASQAQTRSDRLTRSAGRSSPASFPRMRVVMRSLISSTHARATE